MKNDRTRRLAYSAMFAALTAVFSWISLPIGPVPINLALLSVLLCGALLGKKYGLLAILCYILLGAVGVPVFSGFRSGVGTILGATGGYIVGYLPAAVLAGIRVRPGKGAYLRRAGFMALGVVACYALGTAWFMHLTGRTLLDSLTLCVLPFLPGDAAKILLASFLTERLRKPLQL